MDTLGKDALINCARTAMSSKIIGADEDFFSKMAVDAMLAVKTTNPEGKARCGPDARSLVDLRFLLQPLVFA